VNTTKRCCENPACGKALVRGAREAQFHWDRRRACSRTCAGVLGGLTMKAKVQMRQKASIEPARFCAASACGAKLVRRAGESLSDFRGRKTCSRPCAAQYLHENGGPVFVQKQKSSKAPCTECYGQSWRRPVGGRCSGCGGAFREEGKAA